MVQIETKDALDAVEEIAAVDAIDVLFIGFITTQFLSVIFSIFRAFYPEFANLLW